MSLFENVKHSITIRMVSIGFIILVLLIPSAMIEGLIRERERTQKSAIDEVSSKWGDIQTVTGPFISVPYRSYYENKRGKVVEEKKYAHFLPERLFVSGQLNPEVRKRGIYEIIVYNTELELKGEFAYPDFTDWDIAPSDILWDEAAVAVGIPDMRGIEQSVQLDWNTTKHVFNPGIESRDIVSSGISTYIPLKNDSSQVFQYKLKLYLKGSKELNFIPLGKETNVVLNSEWANPKFDGAFLPDEREISEKGFHAKWNVLHLNRNYPQKWRENSNNISKSIFGVVLLLPVDQYQKSIRTAKYALMFIVFTFMIFFFVEVFNHRRIHPIQYILVGFALIIFYTLLLSLSEHFGFNISYIVSSLLVASLITFYSASVFQNRLFTMLMGAALVILYGFIYVILQLQDYALLMGSIGLFVVLSVVMVLTRKVDWYSVAQVKTEADSE